MSNAQRDLLFALLDDRELDELIARCRRALNDGTGRQYEARAMIALDLARGLVELELRRYERGDDDRPSADDRYDAGDAGAAAEVFEP